MHATLVVASITSKFSHSKDMNLLFVVAEPIQRMVERDSARNLHIAELSLN